MNNSPRHPSRTFSGHFLEHSFQRLVAHRLVAHKFEHRGKFSDYAVLYRGNHQARPFEAALRARWPDCSVHLFGSRAVGLASAASDVDACVLLPSMPLAHCRDAAGRALVRPLLPIAAECVRECAEVSGLHLVPTGRTPLLRFEFDGSGGLCASVELCVNNTDGLANCAVMRELLGADTAGTSQPLPALWSGV
jgi:hypothetical protein